MTDSIPPVAAVGAVAAAGPAGPDGHRSGLNDPRTRLRVVLAALVVAAVAIGGSLAYLLSRSSPATVDPPSSLIRPSGIPAAVSTPLATLMALSPVPGKLAPNFTLTDQRGRTISLASLRGKVVVLEFMDPHCIDICPLVSQEFVNAYHDLGSAASKVVFAAINVNQYHESVSAMLGFSRDHGLTTIPSWHFFTGSTARLRSAWNEYGVEVVAPNPNADIIHSSIVYFIDPSGRERYVAAPMADHTAGGTAYLPASQLVQWGQGIDLVARQLAS